MASIREPPSSSKIFLLVSIFFVYSFVQASIRHRFFVFLRAMIPYDHLLAPFIVKLCMFLASTATHGVKRIGLSKERRKKITLISNNNCFVTSLLLNSSTAPFYIYYHECLCDVEPDTSSVAQARSINKQAAWSVVGVVGLVDFVFQA